MLEETLWFRPGDVYAFDPGAKRPCVLVLDVAVNGIRCLHELKPPNADVLHIWEWRKLETALADDGATLLLGVYGSEGLRRFRRASCSVFLSSLNIRQAFETMP